MSKHEHESFTSLSYNMQIMEWNRIKEKLAVYKDREMKMRKHLIATSDFNTAEVGTQNIELGNGWQLKAVIKHSHKLDVDFSKVTTALARLEPWQAERLVKWSATLVVSEYKLLEDKARAVIDDVLTITVAAPALSLVPPKDS